MTGFTQIAAAGPLLVALGVCLLAGLVSFASPCVVPLVPGYLSYLAAVVGVDEQPPAGALKAPAGARWRVAGSAALFVAGFTTVFALGWTPCLGPTLAGVITVASATDGASVARGIVLLIANCLGLGIPYLLLAFGSAGAVGGLGWLRRHTRAIQIFGGVLLMAVGALLVTGVWNDFISWLRDAFVSDVRLPI